MKRRGCGAEREKGQRLGRAMHRGVQGGGDPHRFGIKDGGNNISEK